MNGVQLGISVRLYVSEKSSKAIIFTDFIRLLTNRFPYSTEAEEYFVGRYDRAANTVYARAYILFS